MELLKSQWRRTTVVEWHEELEVRRRRNREQRPCFFVYLFQSLHCLFKNSRFERLNLKQKACQSQSDTPLINQQEPTGSRRTETIKICRVFFISIALSSCWTSLRVIVSIAHATFCFVIVQPRRDLSNNYQNVIRSRVLSKNNIAHGSSSLMFPNVAIFHRLKRTSIIYKLTKVMRAYDSWSLGLDKLNRKYKTRLISWFIIDCYIYANKLSVN